MTLPAPTVPFFAPVPFKVRADLYKMGSNLVGVTEHNLFRLDAAYPEYVEAKLGQLTHHPDHARCYLTDNKESLEQSLWQLAEAVARDQAEYFEYQGGTLSSRLLGLELDREHGLSLTLREPQFSGLAGRCHEHLKSLNPFEQLCDFLALAVQEDLVIVHQTGDEQAADQTECLLVALPSHWDPRAKLGLDFGAVHAPVADKAPLLKSQRNLIKAMTQKGPFVRYNWSLAASPDLAQNPALMTPPDLSQLGFAALIDTLNFRVERQTFYPFPSLQRGLFAIRIFQEPLRQTLNSAARKAQFLQTIKSMSDALLAYKGIDRYQGALLEALQT